MEVLVADRRTILRGLSVATALALPATPDTALSKVPKISTLSSPDTALLALGREWVASAERLDRLYDVFGEAQERYELVEPITPEPLFCGPRDHSLFFPCRLASLHCPTQRQWYPPSSVEKLRKLRLLRVARHTLDDGTVVPEWPNLPARSRRDEIVAAHDVHEAECRALKDASGLTAADAAVDAETAVNKALRRRIVEMRALTFEGVLLKASVVSWCYRGLAEIEEELADTTDATNDTLQLSIARDLVAMLGATGAVV